MLIIVYDLELMKPGCVLLQAMYGGTIPDFSSRFDAEEWLLAPTPNLKAYEITEEQLEKLTELHGGIKGKKCESKPKK